MTGPFGLKSMTGAAAGLAGTPPQQGRGLSAGDVCEGNPGEVFPVLGEVPLSVVDTFAAASFPAEAGDAKQAAQYPSLRAPPPGRI